MAERSKARHCGAKQRTAWYGRESLGKVTQDFIQMTWRCKPMQGFAMHGCAKQGSQNFYSGDAVRGNVRQGLAMRC